MMKVVIKKKMKALLAVLTNMWNKYLATIKLFLLLMIVLTSFNQLCSEQFSGEQSTLVTPTSTAVVPELIDQEQQDLGEVNATMGVMENQNVVVDVNATTIIVMEEGAADVNSTTITMEEVDSTNSTITMEEVDSTNSTTTNSTTEAPELAAKPQNIIFKEIKVPEGTSLSLTAQVARTKIAPGFFFDEDGVVTDAIVQIPIWLDIDELIDKVYHSSDDESDYDERKRSLTSFAGRERCFLYKKTEQIVATLAQIPAALSRHCLLRAICDIHAVLKFYPFIEQSFAFELLLLLFSPSLTSPRLNCYKPYIAAEKMGRLGTCSKYKSKCPVNVSSFLFKHTLPSIVH